MACIEVLNSKLFDIFSGINWHISCDTAKPNHNLTFKYDKRFSCTSGNLAFHPQQAYQ